MDANLSMILKFNPVVLGTGIPLVAGNHEARLDLVDSPIYANGFMVVRYEVCRSDGRRARTGIAAPNTSFGSGLQMRDAIVMRQR